MTTDLKSTSSINLEIEYKYFVNGEMFEQYLKKKDKEDVKKEHIVQHYIAKDNGNTVRLRTSVVDGATKHVLCIKGQGAEVNEAEQDVSEDFALAVTSNSFFTTSVEKIRYTMDLGKVYDVALKIEVDVYQGELKGLYVAEIEVPCEGFEVPEWLLPPFVMSQMPKSDAKSLSNYSLSKMDHMSISHVKDIVSVLKRNFASKK